MCNLLPVLKEYSAKTFSRDSVNDVAHVVFLFTGSALTTSV